MTHVFFSSNFFIFRNYTRAMMPINIWYSKIYQFLANNVQIKHIYWTKWFRKVKVRIEEKPQSSILVYDLYANLGVSRAYAQLRMVDHRSIKRIRPVLGNGLFTKPRLTGYFFLLTFFSTRNDVGHCILRPLHVYGYFIITCQSFRVSLILSKA